MTAIVWSEAARALFDLSGPTAVSAGAGSGKTTCLVELCLRLMSGEATGVACEPRTLVAITFTEKAGAELDERLREAIAERAAAAPSREEALAWRARGHALDAMAIGTIHGFARRVLRDHAIAAQLDPDFEVLDEELAALWRNEAVSAAVMAALDGGDATTQLLVAAHGGAGAERGLAGVVGALVRVRATLGHDAPLTPVADASVDAESGRARLLLLTDALVAEAPGIATASGRRAVEQLRAAAAALDVRDRTGPVAPECYGRFAALAAALRGWRPGKSDAPRAVSLKDEVAAACDDFLAVAADALATPQRVGLCALATAAERRYRDRKRGARVLDFDDLLVTTRDLLRRPDGPRDELRRSIRALLVDEYQDVNRVQQEIFELLADPDDRSAPTLVAVGDVKQSIYRFRGADVSVFRGLIERFRSTGRGRVLHLTANHRSSPPVLEVVNAVSARSMQPAPGEPREYELAFRDEDRLVPARSGGTAPACEILVDGVEAPAADRRRREATAIAARIGALVSGAAGVRIPLRGTGDAEAARMPRPGDVAILFRRLTQLSEYERALRAAGIPYRVARGGGFYQAPEVRDLGELAATLADPDDALAWAAVLRSPFCAIGDGALLTVSRLGWGALTGRAPDEVAGAIVASDPEAVAEADRLRRFLEVWAELRARRDRAPLARLLAAAVEQLDVEAVHLASPDGERRVANLRKGLGVASRLDARGATVGEFARRLRLLSRLPPREPEADVDGGDSVALLSIHQAKGLEWPIVFVPDLGSVPPRDHGRALLDGPALSTAWYDADAGEHRATRSLAGARREAARAAAAESPRLLYVALTRARDRLVLSGEQVRSSDTWRALVERGLAERADLVVRIPIEEAATFRCAAAATIPVAPTPVTPARSDGAPPGANGELRIAAPRPASVRIAVTRLADHARCPRRAMLRDADVAERGTGGGPSQDDPDRATARGTLAHAMIAEIDLGAPPLERRAQLASVVTRRGYDPGTPGVRRIMADVARFLDAPGGRALTDAARRGRLRREIPFLLRVLDEGVPCYLDGAIDALVEGDREIAVIDFKYALATPGAVDRYRVQLLAYAAAAGRASGRRVTARLQFLRGDHRAIDVTPSDRELRAFLRDAPRLARAAAEGADRTTSPAELGRTPERCRAERCGFVDRCYR